MKEVVLLNLLSVRQGGQLVRAREFLLNFNKCNENRFSLVVYKFEGSLDWVNDEENVLVRELPVILNSRFLSILWYEYFGFKKIVIAEKVSIILTFSHLYLRRHLGVKSIVGLSNLAPFDSYVRRNARFRNKIKLFLLKKSITLSLNNADLILALSETAKKILVQEGYEIHKIHVAEIGVNFDDNLGQRICQNNDKYLLYVSHFYHYKNHLTLIKAYHRLGFNFWRNYPLYLVGKTNDFGYYESIKTIIEDLGLNSYVVIITNLERDQLQDLYKNCIAFIFPSLVENCPNSLLEAMYFKVPIAMTNLPPMTEYYPNNKYTFNPFSEIDIAEKLQLVVKADRMEVASDVSLIIGKFSWGNFTSSILSRMERL